MILDEILKKLGLNWGKLNKEEKETFKGWENVIQEGEEAERLIENEAFQKILKVAEIRLVDLFNQLLNYENLRDKDLCLKSEINHLLKTFAIFQGSKKQKEFLEAHIKQRIGAK